MFVYMPWLWFGGLKHNVRTYIIVFPAIIVFTYIMVSERKFEHF